MYASIALTAEKTTTTTTQVLKTLIIVVVLMTAISAQIKQNDLKLSTQRFLGLSAQPMYPRQLLIYIQQMA